MLAPMRLPFALLVAALPVVALPVVAMAQTPIHRCIGAGGNPVFTDQPCAALQAAPVAAAPAETDNGSRDAPSTLCAASPDALRQGVIDAFARRDANRLAGLVLWGGQGHRAAVADIQSLAALVRQPLLDVAQADDAATLVLHVTDPYGDGAPREQRFDTVRRAGCLWLRYAD